MLAKISICNSFHPLSSSLNLVIDLVAEKSTPFNTNTTLRSVGGEKGLFLARIFAKILVPRLSKFSKFLGECPLSKINFFFLKTTILRVGKAFSGYIV